MLVLVVKPNENNQLYNILLVFKKYFVVCFSNSHYDSIAFFSKFQNSSSTTRGA